MRITKRFTFETAHALGGYDGPCAHIHGHSYVLDVTVEGEPSDQVGDPKEGMVMDFGDLKRMVQQHVITEYDHALVLHERERAVIPMDSPLFARTLFVRWQPTCENMLQDILRRIRPQLPKDVRLAYARLQETATSWAEWGVL
jgi:6-pyruvoyltetrahydropterin/6-carboxytetrahydropterin synthase